MKTQVNALARDGKRQLSVKSLTSWQGKDTCCGPEVVGVGDSHIQGWQCHWQWVGRERQSKGRTAWRILPLLHFIFVLRYREKVLFPATWLLVVDPSWCIFFHIAFMCLPCNCRSTACSQGHWSPVVLTVPCCFERPYYPLLLTHQKPSFGPQNKGLSQTALVSLPTQIALWSHKGHLYSATGTWELGAHWGSWKADGRDVSYPGEQPDLRRAGAAREMLAGWETGRRDIWPDTGFSAQWERQFWFVLYNFLWTLSGKCDGWFNESLWVCGLCLPVGEISFTPALSHIIKK